LGDRDSSGGAAGLSLARRLAFAMASFPVGALSIALLVYLPPHLSGDLGVGLAVVGGAFATVRVLDTGIDPALGMIMDRTRSPLGRYRLWMLIGAPILMLGTYKLFLAPPGIGRSYLLTWLLVFYVGLSIETLAHPAWASTLATRYHERSRLYGLMAFAAVASAFAVLVVAIGAAQTGRSSSAAVHAIGWLIIIATPLLVGLAVVSVREEVRADRQQHPRLRDLLALLTKRDLLQLYLAQIFLTLGPGWMSSLYLFFSRDVLGFTSGQSSILLAAYILAGLAGAPINAHLAIRIGKHRTLTVLAALYSVGLIGVLAIPHGQFAVAFAPLIWCGFMASGFDLMLRAMLADVADEVRLEQGRERTSLIFGLTVLAGKLATALSIGITFPLLQAFGYVPRSGASNSAAAIEGLKWAFIAGPIVFVTMGGLVVLRWRLTAAEHAKVRARLEDLDAEGPLGASDGEPLAEAAIAARPA
jgi:GPH family glycoside/pentoside/hexuronide:cation symporter